MSKSIRVDIIRCDGHGYCAEILPERITLDDWGYPIIDPRSLTELQLPHARRAIASCPLLALALEESDASRR